MKKIVVLLCVLLTNQMSFSQNFTLKAPYVSKDGSIKDIANQEIADLIKYGLKVANFGGDFDEDYDTQYIPESITFANGQCVQRKAWIVDASKYDDFEDVDEIALHHRKKFIEQGCKVYTLISWDWDAKNFIGWAGYLKDSVYSNFYTPLTEGFRLTHNPNDIKEKESNSDPKYYIMLFTYCPPRV